VGENPKAQLKTTAACGQSYGDFRLATHFGTSKVRIMKPRLVNLAVALAVGFFSALGFAQTESTKAFLSLDQALELYQQYSGKTVLRSPNLPTLTEFNAPIPSSDTNGMKAVFENELSNRGIDIIPLHEVFALAVELGWKDSVAANYIATIKPRPSEQSVSSSRPSSTTGGNQEALPRGTIYFGGADLNLVLDLYATLVNRNVLRGSQLSSPTIKLRTESQLAKSAAIYMLEVALALNGIASVEDGTNFVQVVPLKQVANLKLQAPVRNAGDSLLDPQTVQHFGYFPFQPGKPVDKSRQGAVNDLVAYYAVLSGKIAIPSQPIGGISVVFKPQTPLTKPELLYALETTLALSGLTMIEVDEKTIRPGYASERNQARK